MSKQVIDLKIACPACYDTKDIFSHQESYWIHTTCKTTTTIAPDGYVSCRKKCHRTKFVDCYWNCGGDKHKNGYLKTSSSWKKSKVIAALAAISRRARKRDISDDEAEILTDLIERIAEQFD
mmetsp:Transcript_65950/g.59227  ORF Transcript_65950/g.59227 Transcript_65950/m.59227 type:complete len:122 (-) Transcript_65950:161-526(-)|eukprot:CAMPEP_0201592154 /NCGR_PEP_ID=MMETSP0190_2-20130828/190124_1 /ASSEMBLY_ACC=CAM_ASM_000263 /TAXON_ID=37353 /ORGANISM="Rosalina sp." /LENGTH=121 /DNA_ID=CAMNT_0048050789 /DNA_START=536 /DNA_END=901 /DNA_ORIENTATION=+